MSTETTEVPAPKKAPAKRKPRAKAAPKPVEIQTFTLDGKTYDIATIPEDFKPVFSDIGVVEREIQALNTKRSIANLAREALTTKFKECLPDLTVIS